MSLAAPTPFRARRREPEVAKVAPDPGSPAIARAQALMSTGGALVGLVAVLLPHPEQYTEAGMLIVQGVSVALAVWLWLSADWVPNWVLKVMPLGGTLLVSANVVLSGDATSAFALFYLWVAIYAFYFLSRREAGLQIGFAVANYLVVVAVVGEPPSVPAHAEVSHVTILIGTFLATAIPLFFLRSKVEALWGRLVDAAKTDLLTGLPNARGTHDALATELERARLNRSAVSVLICDLDRFKVVNERLGHRTGDEILRRIGTLFDEATRRIDTVGRTAAGEFTIVLPSANESDAYLVAEQLLARVRRGFRDEFMPLTTSIGIATYPHHAVTVEEILKRGDEALYAAKVLGRDRAVVFSSEVPEVLSGTLSRRPLEGQGQTHLTTMLSLAEAIDHRDTGTARHSESVGRYAEMTARQLGLPERRVERVRLAGILHDIGKIGVSDSILRKPGPLDEDEWEEMRRHPEIGARILGSRELVDIREWVLASHERCDGKGYPRGLKRDQIPLEARILAVADAFEAMTQDRLYRPAMSEEAARAELVACAGAQFDEDVVAALITALDRERAADRAR
jgi:diguanylate cyclase (GGDEF)-like protein/putative nucleotidyltransferase with HDIG domain